MNDTDPTREEVPYCHLYSGLDGTTRLLDTLANALHAAGDAGFPIESHDDRRADIDNHCQRAFEELDSDEPDPETVCEEVQAAARAAHDFYRGLDTDLRHTTLPDHVDSGVHDTLGEYAEYVHHDLTDLRRKAEQYAQEAS